MTETTRLIIEGVVSVILIGRGVMSHVEHKKTGRAVDNINIFLNGEFEKKLAEEKKKWEEEIKTK